jgi:hypothetical protein
MNATLELIKAKQNAIQAEADLQKAKEKADREARIRTFAPLQEILMDVMDLPAKSYGNSRERPLVSNHISMYFNKDLSDHVEFWQLHCGRTGLVIRAKEDGTFTVMNEYRNVFGDRHPVTLEQAKEKLIEHLALIIK